MPPSPENFHESQKRIKQSKTIKYYLGKTAERLMQSNLLSIFLKGWKELMERNLENPKFKAALEKSFCRLKPGIPSSHASEIILKMLKNSIQQLPPTEQKNLDRLWNIVDALVTLLQDLLDAPEEKEFLNQLKRYRGKKPTISP